MRRILYSSNTNKEINKKGKQMNHTTILNKINDLNYKGLKEAYERQMEDTNYHNLSFEDRLYNLLDTQYIFLQNKRIIMNSRLSRIKDKEALVENIDYNPKRKLNKTQILSLITMDFIRNKQNIIITGKTGVGKSMISQALGNRAIVDGFTVYYIRTATLLEDIKVARIDGTYTNLIKKFARYKLLIIDDFGVGMVLVSKGEFTMGSNDGDKDESPMHQVYLDAFYIDKYEVTNKQFQEFIDAGGYENYQYWTEEGWIWKEKFYGLLPSTMHFWLFVIMDSVIIFLKKMVKLVIAI